MSSSSSAAALPRRETGVAGAGPEAGSKAVVLKVFGPELGEALALAAGHGRGKDYRGVLEPTAAVTQCERSGHPFTPDMLCYLCGLPIPAKEKLSGSEDELYVECEHILPVTEARWFLDLYMTTRTPTDGWTTKALELEYAQSHRVCNQAKSNFSFIQSGDPTTGVPNLSSVGIRKILKNIQVRARAAMDRYSTRPELATILQAIGDTILSRESEIGTRVQKIIDHIESQVPVADPANEGMTLLYRVALLVDPGALSPGLREIHDKWYANDQSAQAEKDRLLDAFVTETFETYPQIDPTKGLLTTIGSDLVPPELLTREKVGEVLKTFFLNYSRQTTEPDPTGSFLMTAVMYGIYHTALTSRLATRYTSADYPSLCTLYERADALRDTDGKILLIFADLPTLPDSVKASCEIAKQNQDRAARAKYRADNAAKEAAAAADRAATNSLGRFAEYMSAEFKRPETRRIIENPTGSAKSLYRAAKQAFILTYPEGIERAREEAAETVSTSIILDALKQENPTLSESLSFKAFSYIVGEPVVESKGGPMKGGRRTYRRKPKPSRSFPRTRRVRRSDRSKKLTRRSSQKSRPETETPTFRY